MFAIENNRKPPQEYNDNRLSGFFFCFNLKLNTNRTKHSITRRFIILQILFLTAPNILYILIVLSNPIAAGSEGTRGFVDSVFLYGRVSMQTLRKIFYVFQIFGRVENRSVAMENARNHRVYRQYTIRTLRVYDIISIVFNTRCIVIIIIISRRRAARF